MTRPHMGPWRLVGVAIAWLAVAALAAPALAHEEEKAVPARTLADEAIAIIRSQPEQMDAITDKVNDATESEDAAGVSKPLLEQAKTTLGTGDLSKTELLLEEAVGTCPGQPVTNPAGVRKPLKLSAPCPAPAHLTALGRQPITGAAKPVLLGLGALLALGGLLLAWRIT
ncbi:MAG TPA: hypothetical protein VFD04_16555 [Actinomycetes bacterium]|nr:hypothetical protein [Actinomycetes bacterium]